MIGRWLVREPEVLLFDEPTRGIDVAAKFAVYRLIDDLARRGKAVVVVSSEVEELLDPVRPHRRALGRPPGRDLRARCVVARERSCTAAFHHYAGGREARP